MQVTRRSTATPLTARREPGGAHRSARRHCRPARLAPTDPLGETPGDGRRATGDGRVDRLERMDEEEQARGAGPTWKDDPAMRNPTVVNTAVNTPTP